MANDNIFQQYLKPPKSVMEFSAEMDDADTRKQTLQSNALTLAAGQQKQADSARDRDADNVLSRLYASGQNTDQIAVGLAQAGYGKHALAFTKQQQDLAKDKALTDQSLATTGKTTQETSDLAYKQREEKRQKSISDIAAFTDPQQALASLALHEQAGDIAPEQAALVRQTIPQNPADFPKWQVGMLQRIMSAKDAAGQIAPDANAVLQAKTTTATNAATVAASRHSTDSSARTAGNRLAFDKDQATAENAPDTTTQKEKELWLHTYTANNGQMPRSAPPAVRKYIGTWAAEMGITPNDLSSGSAKAKFDQAMAVTAGHRGGAMASVEATMPALVENAQDLSRKLGQGKFVPLNKLAQMSDESISDPTLAAFKVAHMAVVSEYQQVISRGGTNVTALNEAMHVLNGARSVEAYDAAMNMVKKEVAINVAGTKAVRAGMGGGEHGAPAKPVSGAKPSLDSIFGK